MQSIATLIAIFTGLLVLASAVVDLGGRILDDLDWRDQEYEKLSSLKAGFDLRFFEDQLGVPVFVRRSEDDNRYIEHMFRGREYWAQTISRNGTVELYAVTSCHSDFKPAFAAPGLSPRTDAENQVTLEETTLAEVHDGGPLITYEYLLGSSFLRSYEAAYAGLASNYKTFVWGATSACHQSDDVPAVPPVQIDAPHRGVAPKSHPPLSAYRNELVVNTFAEVAPFSVLQGANPSRVKRVDLSVFHGLPIGPSTFLIRSIEPNPPR